MNICYCLHNEIYKWSFTSETQHVYAIWVYMLYTRITNKLNNHPQSSELIHTWVNASTDNHTVILIVIYITCWYIGTLVHWYIGTWTSWIPSNGHLNSQVVNIHHVHTLSNKRNHQSIWPLANSDWPWPLTSLIWQWHKRLEFIRIQGWQRPHELVFCSDAGNTVWL